MHDQRGAIAAAIDVGSNSAHLLVAEVRAGGVSLVPLLDESVFLGLGERVGSAGVLGTAVRATTVDALHGYVERARALGAPSGAILVFGTEPIRRAGDGARLCLELERVAGVPLHVVDHEEEGLLTLLGVLGGRPAERATAIVDSGGGSTEVVIAGPGGRHTAHGLRLGSATLTAAHVRTDPPSRAAFDSMRAAAVDRLAALPRGGVGEVIAVGGSTSNLAKVHAGAREDRRITSERLTAILEELLTTPAAGLIERYGLNPRRASLMAAAVAIVDALLERLGVDELRVIEEGVREGAILAVSRAGAGWRDRLAALATGSSGSDDLF